MAVHNKLSLVSQYKLALASIYSSSSRKGPRTTLPGMDSQQVLGRGRPQSHHPSTQDSQARPVFSSLLHSHFSTDSSKNKHHS